ncbi:hypothetical protein Dda_9150 [Drechslerella dactyloides]|uniref:Uncharacterized protein n=1 Tax=Drechslerella dactyloides TaxID=74499 RepID=A0AAD6NGT5_DREDA|nr:hypothetical protein Dda_9150 [Drechslerella dactyloides]
MKLFSYTLLLAAAAQGSLGAILERNSNPGGCNANNCARAVTGTRGGEAVVTSHRGDCSSFMQTTVGPGTTIVIPTDVPTYASACTGPAAYSSACSCWGVTPTTIPVNDCRDPGECGTFDIIYDASTNIVPPPTATLIATVGREGSAGQGIVVVATSALFRVMSALIRRAYSRLFATGPMGTTAQAPIAGRPSELGVKQCFPPTHAPTKRTHKAKH